MDGSTNYWMKFIDSREKYKLTLSLFRDAKYEEAFCEIDEVEKELSKNYSRLDLEVKLVEILLKRDENIYLKYWTPIHLPFFGEVFNLHRYKESNPPLEKCQKYLLFLADIFREDKKGFNTLKRNLGDNKGFQKGIFFEMEADVILAKSTFPPHKLNQIIKPDSKKDVDFVGKWNEMVSNFEIKSLTRSPKCLGKDCVRIYDHNISIEYFKQDRRNRIKGLLLDAIEKFESGANNFVIIPDADRLPTEVEHLEYVIEKLVNNNSEVADKILAVIMYRTDFLQDQKPHNRCATISKVRPCPGWVDDFFKAFCSAEA